MWGGSRRVWMAPSEAYSITRHHLTSDVRYHVSDETLLSSSATDRPAAGSFCQWLSYNTRSVCERVIYHNHHLNQSTSQPIPSIKAPNTKTTPITSTLVILHPRQLAKQTCTTPPHVVRWCGAPHLVSPPISQSKIDPPHPHHSTDRQAGRFCRAPPQSTACSFNHPALPAHSPQAQPLLLRCWLPTSDCCMRLLPRPGTSAALGFLAFSSAGAATTARRSASALLLLPPQSPRRLPSTPVVYASTSMSTDTSNGGDGAGSYTYRYPRPSVMVR